MRAQEWRHGGPRRHGCTWSLMWKEKQTLFSGSLTDFKPISLITLVHFLDKYCFWTPWPSQRLCLQQAMHLHKRVQCQKTALWVQDTNQNIGRWLLATERLTLKKTKVRSLDWDYFKWQTSRKLWKENWGPPTDLSMSNQCFPRRQRHLVTVQEGSVRVQIKRPDKYLLKCTRNHDPLGNT